MANKDFLSQFSENNKPASFKEEERIPIKREAKKTSPKFIIFGLIALLIIAAILFIIFFLPKIKVEDFTGLKQEDAVAWIRQQGLEASGILFKEEYNFDTDKGVILSQEPNSGKVSKDAKMTFIVSGGPDPNESISVPDFKTMDKEQISAWISQNKLLSTKLNTTYSDDVEVDQFIKADYSGCSEDDFTRGCTLKISISKGKKPQDEISMLNFVKKSFAEFENWASSKKLVLNKTEAYSDTIETGYVISQSVAENEKVVAGDKINVVVSKGKAVYAKNFVGEPSDEVQYWASKNGVYLITKERYSNDYSKGEVISQSIAANAIVKDEFVIEVSLGNPTFDAEGRTYDDLKKWINEVNEKGADLSKGNKTYQNSDTVPVGYLISIGSTKVGSSVNPVISIGKNILLKDLPDQLLYWNKAKEDKYTEEQMRKLCDANEGISCVFTYDKSSEHEISQTMDINRSDDETITAGTYISQNVDIIIKICEEKVIE